MFSDYDGEHESSSAQRKFRPFSRKISDSSLSDLPERACNSAPEEGVSVEIHETQSSDYKGIEDKPNDVRIDMESPEAVHDVYQEQHNSSSRSPSSSSSEEPSDQTQGNDAPTGTSQSAWGRILSNQTAPSLKVPGASQAESNQKTPGINLLSGISKTYHKWRTKTKKKKKFHYEKYIIYLESILPTVGFSIGGVIIDWNGIYTFIVIMTFMVGVFAQEAFFGT